MLLEKLVIPIGFDTGLLMEGISAIQGLITGAVERTQQWAEDLDKLGDVTGMSTDNLAAWSYAAQKAGVDTGVLSRSSVILAKGLVAADGSLDTTGKSLAAFGINVFDANGKVKEQSVLLADVSKKYAELGTQTQRVDFLTSIFGRSGAELIDVFDTMAQSGGIDMVKQKVQDLGLVLDPAQYENFQRNLGEVQMTFTGLANAFTGPLMPAAEKLLGIFTDLVQSPWVAEGIKKIGEKFGTLATDIATGIATGDWSNLWGDMQKYIPKFDPVALTQAFRDWMASVDWFSISTDFAVWIKYVDWAGGTKAAIDSTVNILLAFEDLIKRTNWTKLGEALKVAITGVIRDGIGRALYEAWSGAIVNFWNMVDREFGTTYGATAGVFHSAMTGGGGATHRASGGSAGGMTWVGERGPELVNLPNGSFVNRASESGQQIDYDQMGKSVARHLVPALQAAGLG